MPRVGENPSVLRFPDAVAPAGTSAGSPVASTVPAAGVPQGPQTQPADRPAVGGVGTGQRTGIAGLSAAQAAAELARPSMVELIPGRYPNAVSLPGFLKAIGSSPEGQAAVKQLMEAYSARTGIPIPPSTVTAVLARPERVLDLLAATPKQMSLGVDLVNASNPKPLEPRVLKLPSGFALEDLDRAPHERPAAGLQEIAPNLFKGVVPSELSDTQVKRNLALAEVFHRLAANADKPAEQRFSVKLGGVTHQDLDGFLAGLLAQGYRLTARVEHRIANFAGLMTKGPEGQLLDVPAPALVRTGVKRGREEAVVPATHSELVLTIEPPANDPSSPISGQIKFYQGISGTGFWAVGTERTPEWCGGRVADTFQGVQAARAISLAGTLGDVINAVAAEKKLAVGGYGATGVCNDSVAVIQQVLTRRTTAFPLLMRDKLLDGEMDRRRSGPSRANIEALLAAIHATPSDAEPNSRPRRRAEASLPWSPGKEPFLSSSRAREILSGA